MAPRGVGQESEAERVRFHGRRVTKVVPEVKHSCRRRAGAAEQGMREAHSGAAGRSAGGEGHDRFGVVVGKGVVEPRIEGRFARRVGAGMHAHPLLPEPEMAQDALDEPS